MFSFSQRAIPPFSFVLSSAFLRGWNRLTSICTIPSTLPPALLRIVYLLCFFVTLLYFDNSNASSVLLLFFNYFSSCRISVCSIFATQSAILFYLFIYLYLYLLLYL
nr:MAG TPA: hypothetical protein [Caudoviricetes sp.]